MYCVVVVYDGTPYYFYAKSLALAQQAAIEFRRSME